MAGKQVVLLLLGIAATAGRAQIPGGHTHATALPPNPNTTVNASDNQRTDGQQTGKGSQRGTTEGPGNTPKSGSGDNQTITGSPSGVRPSDTTNPGKDPPKSSTQAGKQPSVWNQITQGIFGGATTDPKSQGPKSHVPYVVGMTSAQAVETLNSDHLRGACRDGNGDEVTQQRPEAGAIVPENSDVVLFCKTSTTTIVPSLLNMTAEQTGAVLSKYHLRLGQVTGTDLTASIFRQSPVAGMKVNLNTAVDVWLQPPTPVPQPQPGGSTPVAPATGQPAATGPENAEPSMVRVPNVVGKSNRGATEILRDVSLVAMPGGGPREGVVTSQSPAAGSETKVGSPVELVIQVRVPELQGHPSDQAQKQLQALDLVMSPTGQAGSQPGDLRDINPSTALVLTQSPSSGSLVDPGTLVQVTFGGQRNTLSATGPLRILAIVALGICVLGAGVMSIRLWRKGGGAPKSVRTEQLRTLTPPTVVFTTHVDASGASQSRYSGRPAQVEFMLRVEAVPDKGQYTIKREPAVLERRRD